MIPRIPRLSKSRGGYMCIGTWILSILLPSKVLHGYIPFTNFPRRWVSIRHVGTPQHRILPGITPYHHFLQTSNKWKHFMPFRTSSLRSAIGNEHSNATIIAASTTEASTTTNTAATAKQLHVPRDIEPLKRIIRLRGSVDTGYGRGGKKLGFPTANLPSSLFQNALQEVPTGVYLGWAWIEHEMNPQVSSQQQQPQNDASIIPSGRNMVHKAAVNVGYSPTFQGKENKEKIVEAHFILETHDCDQTTSTDEASTTVNRTAGHLSDFYGETMRLVLIGYLRPECKFNSFPELVQAITNDVATIKVALNKEPYASFQLDPLFSDQNTSSGTPWVGRDGGDILASWEFQDWDSTKTTGE